MNRLNDGVRPETSQETDLYGGNVDDLSRLLDSMPSLAERRGRLTEKIFTSLLLNPTSCLYDLIQAKRHSDVICTLRNAK